MVCYPAGLETALGFDLLRERLLEQAMSRAGVERLAAMRPLEGEAATRDALRQVAEYLDALRFDDRVPFDSVPDVRDGLSQIAPEDVREASRSRAQFPGRPGNIPWRQNGYSMMA
jgi:dsDNA-specific endonuclease/ATPase MutS2